jgi:quercetin dioxygenase-like cupin family protein
VIPAQSHFVGPREVQHGEMPWCKVEWMANPEIVGAKDILMVRATFEAGSAHRFHKHPGREEIIYVLEGSCEQWVGKERRVLGPGEMAHIPKNTPHATRNAGQGKLVFLAILSPAEAAGEFTVDVFEEEPWRSIWEKK